MAITQLETEANSTTHNDFCSLFQIKILFNMHDNAASARVRVRRRSYVLVFAVSLCRHYALLSKLFTVAQIVRETAERA